MGYYILRLCYGKERLERGADAGQGRRVDGRHDGEHEAPAATPAGKQPATSQQRRRRPVELANLIVLHAPHTTHHTLLHRLYQYT